MLTHINHRDDFCHAFNATDVPRESVEDIHGFKTLSTRIRFNFGERLESGLLTVLECLVEAAYTRDKTAVLTRANHRLAVVRHLWRLCHELEVIPQRRFLHAAELIVALGRQIGGWQRASSTA